MVIGRNPQTQYILSDFSMLPSIETTPDNFLLQKREYIDARDDIFVLTVIRYPTRRRS
jgi:hypothetical protein